MIFVTTFVLVSTRRPLLFKPPRIRRIPLQRHDQPLGILFTRAVTGKTVVMSPCGGENARDVSGGEEETFIATPLGEFGKRFFVAGLQDAVREVFLHLLYQEDRKSVV